VTTRSLGRTGFTSHIPADAYRFPHVRRLLSLIAALSLVAGACSDGDGDSAPTTGDVVPTTEVGAPGTTGPTADDGGTTTSTAPEGTTTLSDRPLAPDFTLELGDGGSYTLSEGAKPVYLVFWAEW